MVIRDAESHRHNGCLYFAYGSNLNRDHWIQWCRCNGSSSDDAKLIPIGMAHLPDMELAFERKSSKWGGGVLNLRRGVGCCVTGFLFRPSPSAWRLLDKKEGHPDTYRSEEVTVIGPDGEYHSAITYVVRPCLVQEKYVEPSDKYLEICRTGREERGLETRSLSYASKGKPAEPLDALFVYGTLMRGESRFPFLAKAGIRCALLADAKGCLLDCGEYPGMIDGDDDVRGDFIRCEGIKELLPELDRIEGFKGFADFDGQANLFRRTIMDVHVGNGRIRRAWTYRLCRGEGGVAVTDQDWRRAHGRTEAVLDAIMSAHAEACPALLEKIEHHLQFGWRSELIPQRLSMPSVREALGSGALTEREIAQASGLWTAWCGTELA